jgi:hypothetical protein
MVNGSYTGSVNVCLPRMALEAKVRELKHHFPSSEDETNC